MSAEEEGASKTRKPPWWRSSKVKWVVLAGLVAFAVLSGLIGHSTTDEDLKGMCFGFVTELSGAVITFILLELIVGGVERQEEKKQQKIEKERERKRQLIAMLRSREKTEQQKDALDELKRCWLYDGSLNEQNLEGANLSEMRLAGAKLRSAILIEANLQCAHLGDSILDGAYLTDANLNNADLDGAKLMRARLDGATLIKANLRNADLSHAHLEGANLTGADLTSANWSEVVLDEDTILPDGVRWTTGIKLEDHLCPAEKL